MVTEALGSLSCSKLLSTLQLPFFRAASRAGKVGTLKERMYTQTKPEAVASAENLFRKRVHVCLARSGKNKVPGKSRTWVRRGYGLSSWWQNISLHRLDLSTSHAELSEISVQKDYKVNFHVLSVFESLAIHWGNELWEETDPKRSPKWIKSI